MLHTTTYITLLLVYVDDIILNGSNKDVLKNTITKLQDIFAIKNLGDLHYFLGIQVSSDLSSITISQTQYIHDLLNWLKFSNLKSTPSPMANGRTISLHDGMPMIDVILYRSTLGSSQYLLHTRLDTTFTINKLSQLVKP